MVTVATRPCDTALLLHDSTENEQKLAYTSPAFLSETFRQTHKQTLILHTQTNHWSKPVHVLHKLVQSAETTLNQQECVSACMYVESQKTH